MAEFTQPYETHDGGNTMTDAITGMGGFATGAIVGGLAGYALSGWNRQPFGYGGYGVPFGVQPVVNSCCSGYSCADVANLTATKDAQYQQLNATQSSEFNILNTISRDNTSMAKDLCGLAYENSVLNNQVQMQIAQASAKADLCCCETQGLVSRIVPELKQFYLEDEVAKLRNINAQQNTQCGFDKVNMNLGDISCGIKAILTKLYEPTTTTTTTP